MVMPLNTAVNPGDAYEPGRILRLDAEIGHHPHHGP